MLNRINGKVEIEEERSVGKETQRGKKMVLVKLKKSDLKRQVMIKKRALYGSSERIGDDWTCVERNMPFK